jgi:hypothetical protein
MNKGLAFSAGVAIGTGVMYLLDPDKGKRRRTVLQDQFRHTLRRTNEGVEKAARDLRNRARGIAAKVESRFTTDEVTDDVLVDRVRSKIGRAVSHPSAIKVSAKDGNITLRGPVLEAEVDSLLRCVRSARGVIDVNNQLEVHEEPGDLPALQGGRQRTGHRFEFMQENWSPAARLIAGAAGASLAVYGGIRRDSLGAGLGTAGLLLLARGISNVELKTMAGLGNGAEKSTENTGDLSTMQAIQA